MNSSLLGDRAKDINSFTQSLIRETEQGPIKVPHLMLVNSDKNRKCELGGGYTTNPRWLTEKWPLGAEGPKETSATAIAVEESNGEKAQNLLTGQVSDLYIEKFNDVFL